MHNRQFVAIAVVLFSVVVLGILLFASPLLARWGSTTEVARWPSTNGTYGVNRPIWLSIQKDVSYVDVFSLYPNYRLFITDGGYAYVQEFDIQSSDQKRFLAGCQVTWKSEGAELVTPDGEKLFVPAKLILGRIGAAASD